VRHRHQPHRLGAQQAIVDLHVQRAIIQHRHNQQPDARLLPQELPGDDVRVVLHLRDHYRIVRAEAWPAPALRHQVDALRRVAGKHDLPPGGRVDERPNLLARAVISRGRLLAQTVDAAMHVGVGGLVVAAHRRDHLARLLAGGVAVQIHQRNAGADFLLKNREVLPYPVDIQRGCRCHGCCSVVAQIIRVSRRWDDPFPQV